MHGRNHAGELFGQTVAASRRAPRHDRASGRSSKRVISTAHSTGSPGAVELQSAAVAADRHDAVIKLRREALVDLQLRKARRLALLQGRIVEKRKAHRALHLVGALARQNTPKPHGCRAASPRRHHGSPGRRAARTQLFARCRSWGPAVGPINNEVGSAWGPGEAHPETNGGPAGFVSQPIAKSTGTAP